MRNPDRELDGTNTEDFPTGEAGRRLEVVWDIDKDIRYSVPVRPERESSGGVAGALLREARIRDAELSASGQPPRRIANVRRTADAVRAFLRFLGLLALAMGLILGLLLAADRLLPSTTRPTTTTSEGPG